MRLVKGYVATLIIFAAGFLCLQLPVMATNRNFPGLSIVTRAAWGADESLRRMSNSQYENFIQFQLDYEQRLSGSKQDIGGKFAAKKLRDELRDKREDFLEENYPAERILDSTISEENGHKLWWPWSYHQHKTKIVIHHTATNEWYTTSARAMSGVREIYKEHAVNNGRGDIGYNFLIDPLGAIYEGRSGGSDIIGAHADRNNTSTIGVSLLGNFNIHHPSLRMRQSLKKLLVALVVEYDIDPTQQQPYFTAINEEPWLEVHEHSSLVGHSDTKNTACPGEDITARLPQLRTEVDAIKDILDNRKVESLAQVRFMDHPLTIRARHQEETATYLLPSRVVRSCVLLGDGISLEQCGSNGKELVVTIRRAGGQASGWYPLLVETDGGAVWIDVMIVWQEELDGLLAKRRDLIGSPPLPMQAGNKIQQKISPAQAEQLVEQLVNVLLYEPTADLERREFACESGCTVQLDDNTFEDAHIVHIVPDQNTGGNLLQIFIDQRKYMSSTVNLLNTGSVITLENYGRGSEKYPLNYFRGNIHIQYEPFTRLGRGIETGWTIVNQLSLQAYLQGMAETIETQHPEKLHVMALLAKQYILYYMGGNQHPSIPDGVSYQAIDDPRLFQKYVGAGIEQTTPIWQAAVHDTKDELVVYEDFLPILPYFHCSAGFIRSGKERFGRTDTPWLVSKLDVATCPTGKFDGHGVGLSGDGAEKLAQRGVSYKDILKYYYEGVDIIDISK